MQSRGAVTADFKARKHVPLSRANPFHFGFPTLQRLPYVRYGLLAGRLHGHCVSKCARARISCRDLAGSRLVMRRRVSANLTLALLFLLNRQS